MTSNLEELISIYRSSQAKPAVGESQDRDPGECVAKWQVLNLHLRSWKENFPQAGGSKSMERFEEKEEELLKDRSFVLKKALVLVISRLSKRL